MFNWNSYEQYSGEELEIRLSELSTAFDLTVTYMTNRRAMSMLKRLSVENLLMQIHNNLFAQGVESHFFNGTPKDVPFGNDVWKILETFASVMQESKQFFAKLVREFIAENGMFDPTADYGKAEAILRDAGSPDGGFTFDEMTALREIVTRPILVSDSPGGHIGTWITRSETTFDELARAFSNLMP